MKLCYENNGLQADARKPHTCIQVWLMHTYRKTCLSKLKQE